MNVRALSVLLSVSLSVVAGTVGRMPFVYTGVYF